MPSNKKPRKKYRPRVIYNPIELALQNVSPVTEFDPAYVLKLKLLNHQAMDSLVKGRATKDDVSALMACHNIMEAWRMMGICTPIGDEILTAKKALVAICIRAISRLKFVPTGPEINAINTLLELHDEMLPGLTAKDFDEGIVVAKKAIRDKQATVLPDINDIQEAYA